MSTNALTKSFRTPSLMDDFFKPWSTWFDDDGFFGKVLTMPAVNVKEDNDHYTVSLAAPGLKKDDFRVDMEGNMLTISSEKEERKEDKEEKFTRKEYSYASFSRTFTLPEDVKSEAIEARYSEGVLNIKLPRKEEAKRLTATKHITVK